MTKWVCPCNGCKRARKEAFQEILDILESGGDAYFRMHSVYEHIRKELPKKKETTPKPQG